MVVKKLFEQNNVKRKIIFRPKSWLDLTNGFLTVRMNFVLRISTRRAFKGFYRAQSVICKGITVHKTVHTVVHASKWPTRTFLTLQEAQLNVLIGFNLANQILLTIICYSCSSQRDIRVPWFNYRSHHMLEIGRFQNHHNAQLLAENWPSPVRLGWEMN